MELKAENCLKCAFGTKSEGKIEDVKAKCILEEYKTKSIYEKDVDGESKWFCYTFITPEENKKGEEKKKTRGY